MFQLIVIGLFLGLIYMIVFGLKRKDLPPKMEKVPDNYSFLLEQHVAFYRALDEAEKKRFELKMAEFLSQTRIEGVKTEITETDKVLVAASAVIPIFAFRGWSYTNLTDVLLYPEDFNTEFDMDGHEKPVMGMVGTGYMNHKMVLSKPALYEGFKNETDKNNTAIHEFVHLVDKMDGDIDGIPEMLLEKQYTIPWIDLMHQKISEIMKGRSDINPYGASDKAEFFAVVAEYFFERPDLFEKKHPDLFAIMKEIFDQHPEVEAGNPTPGRNDDCPCGSGKKYKHCHGK